MILGVGTELVQVAELRESLGRPGRSWLGELYTAGEQATCLGRVDPAPGLAARLAAKRATLAALGHPDGCGLLEVEIVREPSGRPRLALHGRTLAESESQGVRAHHVTLTHLDEHALALVVLESADA